MNTNTPPSIHKKNKEKSSYYINEIIIILCFMVILLYFLSLYYFNANDPSYTSSSYPSYNISNPIGFIGAWVSSLAFYFLGLGAWTFLMPFFLIALSKINRRLTSFNILNIMFFFFVFLITTCFLLSYFLEIVYISKAPFLSGGYLGTKTHSFFSYLFGETGSLIFILGVFFLTLSYYLKLSILSHKLPHAALKMFTWLQKTLHSKLMSFKKKFIIQSSSNNKNTKYKKSDPKLTLEENSLQRTETPSQLFNEKKNAHTSKDISYLSLEKYFQLSTKKESISLNIDDDEKAKTIIQTLLDFGIEGKVTGCIEGPCVTTYEFQAKSGTKQNKIFNLMDDIALSLKVSSIFINPLPYKKALGIQIPNQKRETIFLGNILISNSYQKKQSPLTLALGVSNEKENICEDLRMMPHLLIAGTTGTGKSVCINTLICSIINKSSPENVRILLIDPKILELSIYNGIPHLLLPVITEASQATSALSWAVAEMERRYEIIQEQNVRNIESYQALFKQEPKLENLPYIVIIIDELADLMLSSQKDTEKNIQRLAQKARACGIHMILATQRPSVDVITGVIKANFPCRISFQVASRHDSRTILDQIGSEKLLGKGDMLFLKPGVQKLLRIQGAFVSDQEILQVVEDLKKRPHVYDDKTIAWIKEDAQKQKQELKNKELSYIEDEKYDMAITIAQREGCVSASYLQRQLQIGYNRAARIVEQMESKGLISKQEGVKPRKWLGPRS